MPGGYTHVTLVQEAIEEAFRRTGMLHDDARHALARWKKFCIVGSVSPDYPYLDMLDSHSAAWADAVHKGHALTFLRNGVAGIRGMTDNNKRQKCMAWLFGFASHVAADGTIHPVINLKVGPYEQNKTAHRSCEMSQDVYVQARLNLGKLDFNKQISTNVNDSSDENDPGRMDADISKLWQDLLLGVYSGLNPQLQPPKVDDWHKAMRQMMNVAEHGNILIPFARHVGAHLGLVYPDQPVPDHIQHLEVPPGKVYQDFDAIFSKALNNILEIWGWLVLSLQSKASPLDTQSSWSLDTGYDETNRMTYWS